ncbi:TonB-dependent receptor [Novosphingobium nitrogenifigens]|nr:TonB-dependent receptor [Novosphingobium nitrogenifigens]
MTKSRILLALGTAWLAMPGVVQAQTADTTGTTAAAPSDTAGSAAAGEITVTARRRAETAQSVPASLNVMTGAQMARIGLTDTFQLQNNTPGLAISVADREVNVAIRGIGNNVRSIGADPSNAASINGVYLPRAAMVLGQMFDVERVEVLKGPQGTLYGRNATGGAINMIGKMPTKDFEADGYVGYGSYNMVRAEGGVSGGNDLIQVRVAANYARSDGYTYNLYNGTQLDNTNYTGVRGTITLTPTSNLKATAFWQHSVDDSGLGYGISLDPSLGTEASDSYASLAPADAQRVDPRHIRVNSPMYSRRRGDVGGLTVDWNLGAVAVRSISGYTWYGDADSQDTDGTAYDFEYQKTNQTYRSWSEELQLFSTGKHKLEWLLGMFLYGDSGTENIDYEYNPGAPTSTNYSPAALINTAAQSASQAVYGQLTYHVTNSFAAIVGGRYTHDHKSGQRFQTIDKSALSAELSNDRFTPSFQLQWKPSSTVMFYANAVEGYKSGGINGQDTTGNPVFGPEKVWSYEGGMKGRFFDRRLTINAAGFYMDYSHIQFRSGLVTAGVMKVAVNNAASAKIAGGELSADYNFGNGFSLNSNFTYLHSDVSNYFSASTGTVINGRSLPLAPTWSGSVGADYTRSLGKIGSVDAHVEYTYRSRIIFPFTYDATQNTDGPLGLVNATIRWTHPNGRFYVEGIGRNLTDKLYRVNREDFLPSEELEAFGAPRTVELRIGFKI